MGNNPANWVDPWGLKGAQSGAYGNCVKKCMKKWLGDPLKYIYGLCAAGAGYGIGMTPVGGLTAGGYGGAIGGGLLGMAFRGFTAITPEFTAWGMAGASFGMGIVEGIGVVGSAAAGWAIGTVIQCTVTCGLDPCSY